MESKPRDRHLIRFQVACAVIFGSTVLTAGCIIWPISVPNLPTVTDRLAFTLKWQTISILTLLIGIFVVGNTRLYTTAIDPINGRGEHHVMVHTRYVQNTLEQLFMSVTGQLILSTYLSGQQMRVIPLLVILFVIGRITFWIGYTVHYTYRAFGFALTILPTVAVYCMLCYLFLFY